MKPAGREWRALVSAVGLGPDRYRVVRPARPIAHASLYEGRLGAQLSVDKAATVDLAVAWWPARPRAAAPQPRFPRLTPEARPGAHRGFRDRLRWTVAADTLFVVGSRRAVELHVESRIRHW